ncbi:MAG TPA: HAD family hydrolase [Candidatus Binataceae bacterium]|nr:HAD family hydrolase [Candidatus Binataceae bacterium]
MAADTVVFLLDIDNTLVNNDAIVADLMKHIEAEVGLEQQKRYWEYFEELRTELGYADYLGALQRYRVKYPRDLKILRASLYLVDYHFANRLFPESLDVVEHAQKLGTAVILSDGDVVFQPHKIERSGIYDAIDGNVLIYIHKEKELDDVETRYPAEHYVLVDDKVGILAKVKKQWGSRVTTVFPRQGHYALDEKEIAKYPAPDFTIERIGDFLKFDLDTLLRGAKPAS